MTYEHLLVQTRGRVGVVRLNRPQRMNALNDALAVELKDALERFDADEAIAAIVLTGNDRAFAAGADVTEMVNLTPVEMYSFCQVSRVAFSRIEDLKKPVIAALNGLALGGGTELALVSDFRLAADTAKLGLPEINLGIIPGYAGTQRLSRLVGRDRAKELVLTGRHVSAAEALAMGLATRVVPAASLMDEALAFAAVPDGTGVIANSKQLPNHL